MAPPGRSLSTYDRRSQIRRLAEHSPTESDKIYSKQSNVQIIPLHDHKKSNNAQQKHDQVIVKSGAAPEKQRHAHSQHRRISSNHSHFRSRNSASFSKVKTHQNSQNKMNGVDHNRQNGVLTNGYHHHNGAAHQHGPAAPPLVTEETRGVLHRPLVKSDSRDPESELTTSFDPMKDRHMWAMWRTAVNGRIRDEIERLEKAKAELGPAIIDPRTNTVAPGLYGTALISPPLRRFIRLGEDSKEVAKSLMYQGRGGLVPTQFIFYGLPRVYIPQHQAPPLRN